MKLRIQGGIEAMHKSTSSKENCSVINEEYNREEYVIIDEENNLSQPSIRNILGFIEKYDRLEVQELLSQINCHWLLPSEVYKLPTEHPSGIISQMGPIYDKDLIILLPFDSSIPDLNYREIHQILRELTIGIYILNQHPILKLEANFDESTFCQIPPAYIDTRLGQIMINTDYWLKALWHGKYLMNFIYF